jgi:two-component system, OmpR family, response regulator ArlR
MSTQKILIVEDEKQIARFLELELQHEGYLVETAFDGIEGLNAATRCQPDMILLDIMLPGMNGLDVCRRIRQSSCVPIIMLTARDETFDKVMGLDLGATDYVTKPFVIEELLARIRAGLRRYESMSAGGNNLYVGELVVDLAGRTVKRAGNDIELTRHEFDLLAYLIINKGIVLTRDQILANVWSYDFSGEAKIVDVYIRYLRNKIDDKYETKLIHTVRGFGYLVKESCTDAE